MAELGVHRSVGIGCLSAAGHATTQRVNLRPLSLDPTQSKWSCMWRKGQILSDPDCLRAGCKLDDLICPPPKGFVTREGKKTAPHLAQPWHFEVKEVNSEFSVFSD